MVPALGLHKRSTQEGMALRLKPESLDLTFGLKHQGRSVCKANIVNGIQWHVYGIRDVMGSGSKRHRFAI